MLLHHDIRTCFADAIGANGLDRAGFEAILGQTRSVLARLAEQRRNAALPLLQLPTAAGDLDGAASVARRFARECDQVVVLGTGGSSLGGQMLVQLAQRGFGPGPGRPLLHFLDNIDPDTFAALCRSGDLARTGFLVISKSGSTAETLMQFLTMLPRIEAAVGRTRLSGRVVAITEPHRNPLRRLAESCGIEVLDHDPGLGGRFSVLSPVGLLPAMIAGLDAAALRGGAAEVLDAALSADPAQSPPAQGAAVNVALLRQRGIHTTVLMAYADALGGFGLWFRQLWAESLGKNGTGTTPVRAVGAVDQHSQLQLYLDGPADKLFTLVLLDRAGTGDRVDRVVGADPDLAYLAGRSMGDLMEAEQRATLETLAGNGRPVRSIAIPHLDERAMGALLMHFMLETIIAADLLGVNPFDQPAVEEGKRLAREHLAKLAKSR